jgi:hypothetical protein
VSINCIVSVFYYFTAHAAQIIDVVCGECLCDFDFVFHFFSPLFVVGVSVYPYNIPQKTTEVNSYFNYFAFSFSCPARRRAVLTPPYNFQNGQHCIQRLTNVRWERSGLRPLLGIAGIPGLVRACQ